MSNEKYSGKSFVNLRLLKKIGIIGLSVSAAAISLVAVFSLFQSSGKSFTIRLDNPLEQPNLQMSSSINGGDPATYFAGQPILNASQAYGADVFQRVTDPEKFPTLEQIHGSQNLDHKNEKGEIETDSQDAQVYTLYLTAMGDEEEEFQLSLNLDGLSVPYNVKSPLEYYRAMFIISRVDESLNPNLDLSTKVYGNKTTTQQPTVEGENDYRECVSSYTRVRDENGKTIRNAGDDINGQYYCEPFNSTEVNEQLVRFKISIPSKQSIRITFVGYFEGFDPDAYGVAPTEAYMLLSLHFGK